MLSHDVLIVGGGLAGLSAALNIHPSLDVAVVSKVHPLRSHSVAAQGGINAALGNHPQGHDDNWEKHTFDTVKGSDYLADQTAAEKMCRQAVSVIYELEHLGVPFSRFPGGVIAQRPFGGAGFPRTCYAADKTGLVLLHTLYEQSLKKNIKFYSEWLVTDLVVEDNRCYGVVVFDLKSGNILPVKAKAVVFTTGGYGRVYLKSTNALINFGSGIGMAYRAKIPLKDMEFVQFHPTSLYGKNILITEGARGEGGYLLNNKGKRFMADYAPSSMELAPRDIVARAIQTEINKGNGFNGKYVHLDLRHLGKEKILKRLPGIREICMYFGGLDPIDTPIPIQPAQHYSMGGIDVDENCASPVEGFYAAGECACVSVHGANRLGGNSLLEAAVFGKIAGESVSEYIEGSYEGKEDGEKVRGKAFLRGEKIDKLINKEKGENVYNLLWQLKDLMSEKVGIFRDEKNLKDALNGIQNLREKYEQVFICSDCLNYCQEVITLIEFESMLDIAEVITVGALKRRETRGSHYRVDYPKRDDRGWLKHTLVEEDAGRPKVSYKEVSITRYKPMERKY